MSAEHLASTIEMFRTFVPAKDFETSKQFYADLGFDVKPIDPKLADVSLGTHSFLLQDYYVKEWADNFMMHVMVTGLDRWWDHIAGLGLARRYAVREPKAPRLESWGLNVAYVFDPAGVLWHFAERPTQR